MDCGRPRPSGATTPGNSTALRVGRMIKARSGSFGSEADACSVAEGWVVSFMALVRSAKLHKSKHEAAVPEFPFGEPQAVELQRDAPLEAAVGDLQPHDLGVAVAGGQGTAPQDGQHPTLGLHLHGLWRDARQRNYDAQLALSFEDVDRRLPARETSRVAGRLEK